MLKFIIRLDDACENMNEKNWISIENLLDKHNIKPIVGIIPKNKDTTFDFGVIDDFWSKYAKKWQEKGWIIAQHGFNHKYHYYTESGKRIRTEFYGVSLEKQEKMILNGYNILLHHGIHPKCFFAPNHTYDKTTIEVIKKYKEIKFISDGVARYPFEENGMLHFPNIFDSPHKIMNSGVFTFVFHPNNISNEDLERLEKFIKKYRENFNVDFNMIIDKYSNRRKSIIDRILEILIKVYRKLKGNNLNE